MEHLYFTFGSDPGYPYGRDDYLVVIGKDRQDIYETYRRKYPDRVPGSNTLNCADFYTQSEWEKQSEKYYKGVEPKEVLVSDTVYGRKPAGFVPLWFFVPSKMAIVYLQEGSGDNLLDEDIAEGNRDYLDYTAFDMDCGDIMEGDGGQLMVPWLVQEHYGCLADAIPDILDFAFDDMFLEAQVLAEEPYN